MAYDENLADRVRTSIGAQHGLLEKKMFGGLVFTLNGNMAAGIIKDELLVRVSPDAHDGLVGESGARAFEMIPGKSMKGFIAVDQSALADDSKLGGWVQRGVGYAGGLPLKEPKKRKPKKPKTA